MNAPVILVTGASGFLGKHLVQRLQQERDEQGSRTVLRALVRRPTLHLERLGVEVVAGDVCDPEVCAQALCNVTQVYHAAGFVSRRQSDGPAMYRVHIEGTRTLLNAAGAASTVKRVVVVSTSGTVAVSKEADEISNEQSPYRHALVSRWPYYLSKIFQEQTALELGRTLGLDVVIVGPSLLLGPGDDRGSSTSDVETVVRGRLPLMPRGGGVAFVDARDAALGCILAMERGRAAERYLLSAANMSLDTFLGRVARLAGVPAPRPVLPPQVVLGASRFVEALARRFDRRPPIDAQSIEMAEHTWYVDASKAVRELGWSHRDPQQTLVDTVRELERRYNLGTRRQQSRGDAGGFDNAAVR